MIRAYPEHLEKIDDRFLYWRDGEKFSLDVYDSSKSFEDRIKNPSIADQLSQKYFMGECDTPAVNHDPGRMRNSTFFKKMYGSTAREVEANLGIFIWLPSHDNVKLKASKINDIVGKLQLISNELDTLDHLIPYLTNPGGTYNWRKISGQENLSPHSYGIAIDINVSHSHYWRWQSGKQINSLAYNNKIPIEIVHIFEKHGFIWGGKWYHFDTMHFEYRPELTQN